MTIASAYMSLATEGWYEVLSGVKISGAVQLMEALVRENGSNMSGSNMIVFKPKSPRRACGGSVLPIRIFDYSGLQQEVIVNNYDGETHPPNVPVHQIHPMKELQTARYIDQL